MRRLPLILLITITAFLTACGEGAESNPQPATVDAVWMLDNQPANAQSVSEAKATAKQGDHIVVRARIGGRREPITDGSPVFTVMDLSIPHCGQNPDDLCPTPWDYCCETPDTIKANAATVQVVDEQGTPVNTSMAAAGLEALDEVVLVGTVGPRASQDVLTILATGVYRVGP